MLFGHCWVDSLAVHHKPVEPDRQVGGTCGIGGGKPIRLDGKFTKADLLAAEENDT